MPDKPEKPIKKDTGRGKGSEDRSGYYISPIDGKCAFYKDSAYDAVTRKGIELVPCDPDIAKD